MHRFDMLFFRLNKYSSENGRVVIHYNALDQYNQIKQTKFNVISTRLTVLEHGFESIPVIPMKSMN